MQVVKSAVLLLESHKSDMLLHGTIAFAAELLHRGCFLSFLIDNRRQSPLSSSSELGKIISAQIQKSCEGTAPPSALS